MVDGSFFGFHIRAPKMKIVSQLRKFISVYLKATILANEVSFPMAKLIQKFHFFGFLSCVHFLLNFPNYIGVSMVVSSCPTLLTTSKLLEF